MGRHQSATDRHAACVEKRTCLVIKETRPWRNGPSGTIGFWEYFNVVL